MTLGKTPPPHPTTSNLWPTGNKLASLTVSIWIHFEVCGNTTRCTRRCTHCFLCQWSFCEPLNCHTALVFTKYHIKSIYIVSRGNTAQWTVGNFFFVITLLRINDKVLVWCEELAKTKWPGTDECEQMGHQNNLSLAHAHTHTHNRTPEQPPLWNLLLKLLRALIPLASGYDALRGQTPSYYLSLTRPLSVSLSYKHTHTHSFLRLSTTHLFEDISKGTWTWEWPRL